MNHLQSSYKTKTLVLQPTPYCNLRCTYCYLPDRDNKGRMNHALPADTIEFLIRENLIDSEIEIVWHAGEPLTAGLQFYTQALREIDSRIPPHFKITHSVQTNATLINDEWLSLFKQYRFNVGVSLDGPRFLHDDKRIFSSGKGSYDLTLRGLNRLVKNGITPTVIAVLTSSSLDHPDLIYDFFSALNISYLGLNIEEEEGINRSQTVHRKDFLERYGAFFSRIYERSLTGSLKIREAQRILNGIYSKDLTDNSLTTPFSFFCVDYKGNFSTFCPELLGMDHERYGAFTLGNIHTTSVKQILESERFNQIYRDIQLGVQECERTCEYFFLCAGGAPSNKLYENGSFASTATQYCRAKVQVPTQILLPALEAEQRSKNFALSLLA